MINRSGRFAPFPDVARLLEFPVFEHAGEQSRAARQAGDDDLLVQRVQPVALRTQAVQHRDAQRGDGVAVRRAAAAVLA